MIYGRSDATIKRRGVRIGTSEIYRVVESIPEVSDCLAVDIPDAKGQNQLVLFVVTASGLSLDDSLKERLTSRIGHDLSLRHVPDQVIQSPSVPRTLNGKKLEVPIKRVLLGADPEKVFNRGSLQDPSSVDFFIELAARIRGGKLEKE